MSPVAARFRSDVTVERLSADAPRVDALLVWWTRQWQEGSQRWVGPAILRWAGFGTSLLAIALTGYSIVVTPDAPCYRGPSLLTWNAVMALFVIFATFFWFLPRIQLAMRGWALRQASRQAAALVARLRRSAPFAIEYALEGGRLAGRNEKLRLATTTELRRVRRAAFQGGVACLYGGGFPFVKRIVWLPDAAAGEALRSALREAGAEVGELG